MYMGSYKTRVFVNMKEHVLPGKMVDMDMQMGKEYKEGPVVAYCNRIEVEDVEYKMRNVVPRSRMDLVDRG
jgi:hypothetical protein